MTAVTLRTAALLLLLFGGAVGLIRAQPYNDGGLHDFLFPQPACPMPCWHNIRPGTSTPEAVLAALDSVPNIRDIGTNLGQREGQVYWRWQEDAYSFLRSSRQFAHTWVEGDQITNIYLTGFRQFADLRLLLGPPEEVLIHVDAFLGTGNVVYLSIYPGDLYLSTFITCRANRETLWTARTSVSIGEVPQFTGSIAYRFDQPGWLPRRVCSLR